MSETITAPPTAKSQGVATNGNGDRTDARARRVPTDRAGEARLRVILSAMVAFRDGDFSARLPVDWTETEGLIAEAFNQVIAQKQCISKEVTRLSETVGTPR